MDINKLKYPVGKFDYMQEITTHLMAQWISEIESLPTRLKAAVYIFSETELNIPYRKDGWSSRQVIHHLADSHMNGYIRFHWALTENRPVIKPYKEADWAALPYLQQLPVHPSLDILTALHERWVCLLKALTKPELDMTFIHPEFNQIVPLKQAIGVYAWHSNHHLAHITRLLQRGFKN